MKFFGILLAVILTVTANGKVEAISVANNPNSSGGKIILTDESTVIITAWLGKAGCRVGQVNLVSPEVKLVKSSLVNELAKKAKPSSSAP